jgi:hypothetical protein
MLVQLQGKFPSRLMLSGVKTIKSAAATYKKYLESPERSFPKPSLSLCLVLYYTWVFS